nr:response regulator transcription factor [Ramlibacter monticola]
MGPAAFRQSHSVLVVDDNAATKYSVARSLRACGYHTVEASSGAEALELSEFVSAVVLDIHLPDLDGLEVCRLLRARRSTARLPVIHMSAIRIEESDAVAAQESGADGLLAAPVNPSELASALDRLLTTPAAAHGAEGEVGETAPGARSGAGTQSILRQMTDSEKKP